MKKVVSLVFSIVLFVALSSVVGAAGKSELADARKGTAKYHDVQRAIDDGYEPSHELVAVPGLGVMGYHYINPLLVDKEVNAATPEVLLYVPKKNGDLQLVGVEYLSEGPNSLFGQEFDGPGAVPQHSLHAWIWKNNPQGMFAPFNPSIKIK